MKTDIMTGQVQSVCGMFARWSPCFHGGCSFLQAVQLFLIPTAWFKRKNQRLFHNEQCSRKHCRKRGVAHVPRWKCFTIPAITITAAKYYTPVCVSAGWKTTIWLHHLCHSHSTLLSSMWCHIPFLQPWASHSVLLLNHWRAFIVSILIPFLCNSPETGVKTGVECTITSYKKINFSFTSPHLIIIK